MRAAAAATLRAIPRVTLVLPPRWRRRLALTLAAAFTLALLYMTWFRDSSFVAVNKVTITGLTTTEAEQVRRVLTGTAEDMTTLHVRVGELEQSVRGFGVVHALEVEPDFPHTLHIHVIERRAAALLTVDGRRVPVAGDGTVLTGLPVEGRLPVLKGSLSQDGKRVDDRAALTALEVIRAAPEPLGRRILRVRRDAAKGLVAQLRRGPDVILGTRADLPAKWQAAASVLADGAARGATYVDVRLPARPAAGGLGEETVEPAGAEELQAAAAAAAAQAAGTAPPAVTPTTPTTTTPAPAQTAPTPQAGTEEGGAAPQP
jgi:cell division protein FtsQ